MRSAPSAIQPRTFSSEDFPGTTTITAAKNKPNWDAYDSWGGMLAFNRNASTRGSVEAAAFRRILNPWTWRTDDAARSIIEQPRAATAQCPGRGCYRTEERREARRSYQISLRCLFSRPDGTGTRGADRPIDTSYSFDGLAGPADGKTPVTRGGPFVRLHHSGKPSFDEGPACSSSIFLAERMASSTSNA